MMELTKATPHAELIKELMDRRQPHTEREYAAAIEIGILQDKLRTLRDELTVFCETMDQKDGVGNEKPEGPSRGSDDTITQEVINLVRGGENDGKTGGEIIQMLKDKFGDDLVEEVMADQKASEREHNE